MIHVQLNNRQSRVAFQAKRLRNAGKAVLAGEGVQRAQLSLAVVDDATIHELNRRYLQHDYPTDVLSFLLDDGPAGLEGEVIVSADTAARMAVEVGWTAEDELLLYVIHGSLHLAGYDDQNPDDVARMRAQEEHYLSQLGVTLPRPSSGAAPR